MLSLLPVHQSRDDFHIKTEKYFDQDLKNTDNLKDNFKKINIQLKDEDNMTDSTNVSTSLSELDEDIEIESSIKQKQDQLNSIDQNIKDKTNTLLTITNKIKQEQENLSTLENNKISQKNNEAQIILLNKQIEKLKSEIEILNTKKCQEFDTKYKELQTIDSKIKQAKQELENKQNLIKEIEKTIQKTHSDLDLLKKEESKFKKNTQNIKEQKIKQNKIKSHKNLLPNKTKKTNHKKLNKKVKQKCILHNLNINNFGTKKSNFGTKKSMINYNIPHVRNLLSENIFNTLYSGFMIYDFDNIFSNMNKYIDQMHKILNDKSTLDIDENYLISNDPNHSIVIMSFSSSQGDI